ncbi:MAG TPA: sulfatase-like hydrolase/transferase [Vicinamibacterales bacterium]|nr:sulfatase-like hydrolase/transferase [Vicinamibacterales bacterium]
MIRLLVAAASASALLLVSTYDLLASIPFAYQQFIESPPFWWMPILARMQPMLLLASLGGLRFAMGSLSDAGRRSFRLLTIAASTFAACAALPMLVPALSSFGLSAALSFAPLVVLAWASAMRLIESATGTRRPDGTLAAAAIGGLVASAAFALNAGFAEPGVAVLQPREVVLGSAAALVAHVVLFAIAWTAVQAAYGFGARRSPAGVTPDMAVAVVSSAGLSILLLRCVFSSLMLDPAVALAMSVASAASAVLFWMAFVRTAPRAPWVSRTMAPVAIVLCVLALPPMLRFADWASSIHKMLVMLVWLSAYSLAAAVARGRRALAVLGTAVLAGWGVGVVASVREAAHSGEMQPLDASLALERYATVDMSLRALMDVGRPIVSDRGFLTQLRETGDVTYNRGLPAVPLRLAGDIRVETRPPNVLIIVVDSLRPDYLSPYNPRVTFTPAVDAFARDSVVFRRAYTAYSGTGLSEAALWAGALVQRAMYVKPFAAIDNLERLTVGAGYRRYVSIDEVMDRILEDQIRLVRLDADIIHEGRENDAYKLDFCRTVGEFTSHLDAESQAQPFFFYTQPKNLHIRVIAGDTPNYGTLRGADEFFRPAEDTIRRLDGCFGRLIGYLKEKRLYEDSIIVLTADHGDAYGEEGRWGHAFYVTPETLRIPLIVHLPERLRPQPSEAFDADQVAWLHDLTPTLFELLGIATRAVGTDHLLAGVPLFPSRAASTPTQPDLMLVQSSYSRIFGLVDRDARWLYTADANRMAEEVFDLTALPPRRMATTEADRLKYHRWLLERLGRLNGFYAH